MLFLQHAHLISSERKVRPILQVLELWHESGRSLADGGVLEFTANETPVLILPVFHNLRPSFLSYLLVFLEWHLFRQFLYESTSSIFSMWTRGK